ncbi:uncharacterized protein LOC130998153 [Salvia miltiorrhiza]|uniref:uncharacterized protein LOC130998153 n=1 Tax=Salvia miltiorrhiza TaxID=226208 RepID=UPI0025ABD1A0|nr:uncharacterized protein LOC130998153 [Salvia miltiorrhiza]
MGDSDSFGLYIHHGGKFVHLGASRLYSGGDVLGKFGLDKDRFGYFDLEEEIKQLGYTSWRCLAFKVPRTLVFMDLCDDKQVMQMIQCCTSTITCVSIYVDDGKKGKVKKAVTESETVTKTVAKTITTTKSSSNKGKGKGKVNQSKGKEKVFDREEPASVVKKQNVQIELRKGKDTDRVVKEQNVHIEPKTEHDVLMEELHETDEDDDDYVPQFSETEDVESDDSLGDKELGSEDEEYMQARSNVRESIGVIAEMGLEKENEEERLSEYDDSDKERSDSSDSDGQVVRSKQPKVVYDPRGDIADLKLVLGMRFEDGFQCKKALVSWSIVKGHPIHFRRVTKDQCEAYCEEPCQWRIYASIKKKEKSLVVKILGKDHTCAFAIGNKQASYKWLGEEYTEVFRVRPQMCVEDFRNDVKRRLTHSLLSQSMVRDFGQRLLDIQLSPHR